MSPQDPDPADASGPPTEGDATGGHRVLEPPAALAATATRLDAHPDLWDRELRLEITDVVLDDRDLARLRRPAGGDPVRMRAALLEASAERGGLPPELTGTVLVGRVGARGRACEQVPAVGDRVAVPPPATAQPLWLRDISAWTGGPRIPAAGHAIVHAASPLVAVPDDPAAEVVAVVATIAHVPAAVRDALTRDATRTLILGATTAAGACATAVAARAGARAAALVGSLQDARLVRGLGAAEPLIVAPADTRDAGRAVRDALGGPAEVILVADPSADGLRIAAAAVAPAGHVRVLVPEADLDALARDAAGLGRSPRIDLARTLGTGSTEGPSGHELLELMAVVPALRGVVAWRAGTAPTPTGRDRAPDDTHLEGR